MEREDGAGDDEGRVAVRFSVRLERDVIRSLVEEPEVCITFPDYEYRDGTIYVYRDGLAHRLPRYLYERLTGQQPPRFMLRTCKTKGCMNFHHYEGSDKPYRKRVVCPNGHEYTEKNTLPKSTRDRCRKCRNARNARRRKGTGPRPGICAKGHALTDENVYKWTDWRGTVHRRCRRCMKQYQRNYRLERAA